VTCSWACCSVVGRLPRARAPLRPRAAPPSSFLSSDAPRRRRRLRTSLGPVDHLASRRVRVRTAPHRSWAGRRGVRSDGRVRQHRVASIRADGERRVRHPAARSQRGRVLPAHWAAIAARRWTSGHLSAPPRCGTPALTRLTWRRCPGPRAVARCQSLPSGTRLSAPGGALGRAESSGQRPTARARTAGFAVPAPRSGHRC
jgi:hypothetical protein